MSTLTLISCTYKSQIWWNFLYLKQTCILLKTEISLVLYYSMYHWVLYCPDTLYTRKFTRVYHVSPTSSEIFYHLHTKAFIC